MKLSIVILANDPSPRFQSRTPKVLHPLAGQPMIDHTLDLVDELGATSIVVTGLEAEASIRKRVGKRARCVVSAASKGLAGAVRQALDALDDVPEQLVVLSADMPLLRAETVRALAERQASEATPIVALGERRVVCLGHDAVRTYTKMDCTAWLAQALDEVASRVAGEVQELLRIETRVDLSRATTALRDRINERWMRDGVTLIDPTTTYIDAGVTIGRDTVIAPNTHLRGRTTIGEACRIGPNTVIEHCTIGDRCEALASVLEHAVMENDSDIGPFGHLRRGARVCEGAHVGNFGEIKSSTLGPGAKMGHFSYLGDAQVGAEVNIGAGTITCNYDGVRKHQTIIEEGAFIGSDTLLVAPVTVGARAKTGAGSVVTHDLPPDSLSYGVPAQLKETQSDEQD